MRLRLAFYTGRLPGHCLLRLGVQFAFHRHSTYSSAYNRPGDDRRNACCASCIDMHPPSGINTPEQVSRAQVSALVSQTLPSALPATSTPRKVLAAQPTIEIADQKDQKLTGPTSTGTDHSGGMPRRDGRPRHRTISDSPDSHCRPKLQQTPTFIQARYHHGVAARARINNHTLRACIRIRAKVLLVFTPTVHNRHNNILFTAFEAGTARE